MNQLGWPDLPKLVARLKLTEVQQKNSKHLVRMHQCKHSAQVLSGLENFISVGKLYEGTAPLNGYLNSVWEGLLGFRSADLGKSTPPNFSEDLQTALCENPCEKCAAETKCRGKTSTEYTDDDNINDYGYCLKRISDVFNLADKITRKLYDRYSYKKDIQNLKFLTAKLISQLAIEIGRGVDAKTKESGVSQTRNITVSLETETFSLSDYYSLLYIVFHECFVHGFCGIPLDGDDTDISDRFHDGWMDEVCYLLLADELNNKDSIFHSASKFTSYAAEFLEQAQKLHFRRLNFSDPKPPPMAATYFDGAQAARRFLMICIACSQSNETGAELFYEFSLSVNASPCSDIQRSDLVYSINKAFEDQPGGEEIVELVLLFFVPLSRYAEDRDVIALLEFIISIHSSKEI